MASWFRPCFGWTTILLFVAVALPAAAKDDSYEFGGRVSPQLLLTSFPDNSLFRELTGSWSADSAVDARVIFTAGIGRWDFQAEYQFIAFHGDRIEYTRKFPQELQYLFGRLPNDERRLFDLTYAFNDAGKTAVLNRLDRLAVRYTSKRVVAAFGRQAITWGNGMLYTPMDIFNPFDPAAVDREFKTGDDMFYGQYLRGGGDDLQGVLVFRRNPISGDVESDVSSLALKYHGLSGQGEFDALVSRHYGETLLAAGGNHAIGGAVWRGDLVLTFGDSEVTPSFVTSLSQSWSWGGKNVSGVLEYFHNGFGQPGDSYSPGELEQNTELLKRVARGELFTLGKDYLAASAMIELTPLFSLTPNVFVNLRDPGTLVQVVTRNDLREDLLLWCALNVPIGAAGSEFGGIPAGLPGLYLSNRFSVLAQLAWYW